MADVIFTFTNISDKLTVAEIEKILGKDTVHISPCYVPTKAGAPDYKFDVATGKRAVVTDDKGKPVFYEGTKAYYLDSVPCTITATGVATGVALNLPYFGREKFLTVEPGKTGKITATNDEAVAFYSSVVEAIKSTKFGALLVTEEHA